MSKQDNPSYAEKIGVPEIDINTARNVMQLCMYAGLPGLMIGASSVAKTAAVRDLGAHNNARVVIYALSNREPQDITGPQFPTAAGTFVYLRDEQIPVMYKPMEKDLRMAQRVSFELDKEYEELREEYDNYTDLFKFLADAAPDHLRDEMVLTYLRAKDGELKALEPVILFFDEVNRAEKATMNAVMPIWAERKLGPNTIGPNVRVIAAMNPPDGAYAVNGAFSADPAIRRRLVTTFVSFSQSIFQRYRLNPAKAKANIALPPIPWNNKVGRDTNMPFHPAVNGYLNAHPDRQYDVQSYMAERIYGCPGSWEAASGLFEAFDEGNLSLGNATARTALLAAISGCVNNDIAPDVISHFETATETVEPLELVTDFGEERNPLLWAKMGRLVAGGEHAKIQDLINSAIILLQEGEFEKSQTKDIVDSVGNLFLILPYNVSESMVKALGEAGKGSVTSLAKTVTSGLLFGVTDEGDVLKTSNPQNHHPGYKHFHAESVRVGNEHRRLVRKARAEQRQES